MTAAELQTARDELQRAIYSGQLTVRFQDGRMMTYQSVREMREALSLLDAEIAQAGATAANAPRTSYLWYSRD